MHVQAYATIADEFSIQSYLSLSPINLIVDYVFESNPALASKLFGMGWHVRISPIRSIS
jgi:hypothetical protein